EPPGNVRLALRSQTGNTAILGRGIELETHRVNLHFQCPPVNRGIPLFSLLGAALLATSIVAASVSESGAIRTSLKSRTVVPPSMVSDPGCMNDPLCPAWATRYDGAGGYDRGIGV